MKHTEDEREDSCPRCMPQQTDPCDDLGNGNDQEKYREHRRDAGRDENRVTVLRNPSRSCEDEEQKRSNQNSENPERYVNRPEDCDVLFQDGLLVGRCDGGGEELFYSGIPLLRNPSRRKSETIFTGMKKGTLWRAFFAQCVVKTQRRLLRSDWRSLSIDDSSIFMSE